MSNQLAGETSPYLKMHADNPVNWYPWGIEALEKAAKENKPILLSVGYTACHWCHVMAHESFEDQKTAELMNTYFINIKVDREERPDLDKIYQLSAQLLTQQTGGWPLTVFLMPKTHLPFFAGTYFPKLRLGDYPAFQEVLHYVHHIFEQNKDKLQQQNISFKNMMKELEAQSKLKASILNSAPINDCQRALRAGFDRVYGGFGSAPKFPMTTCLQQLLLSSVAGDTKTHEMVIDSLKKMYHGGIYDQVGDGFFRYSVDEKWQIPHFEKMLYDNALLLALLSETFASSDKESFLKEAINQTADWMIREMQGKEGGFYASLAADTEGEEGKFYAWTRDEISNILSQEEYQVASLYYGLDQYPNFHHAWHLHVNTSLQNIGHELNKSITEIDELVKTAKRKLFVARSKRQYPQRDEKIIVSWNGLAIKALALAGFYLGEEKFIQAAQDSINFIKNNLWKDDRLYSVYKDGTVKLLANLDDYVFLIEGILYFLQASWDTAYFNFLIKLINNVRNLFEDEEAGGFYFTAKDHEELIYRLKQYTDEALPSSNAVLSRILLQLGFLLGNNSFLMSAENSLKNAFPHLQKYPDAYCSFLTALACFFDASQNIVVRGGQSILSDWQDVARENYHPNRLVFFIDSSERLPTLLDVKKPNGNIVAYFCQRHECRALIKDLQDFENELRTNKFSITK